MSSNGKHVLIAGGGPVGLISALLLARAGISVTLVERSRTLVEDLRASTFHPPTLEMLARIGIADTLIEQGLIARYSQQRDRHEGLVAQFDMALLGDVTAYPFRLQCEQVKLARALTARLEEFPNCRVLYGAKVVGVVQAAESVTLEIEQDGATATFSGDYLIGADGASSTVRQKAGIAFPGLTYPERFLSVSTGYDFQQMFPDLSYVNYASDPETWYVLLRTPSLWRVLVPTLPEQSDAQALDDDEIEARLQHIFPKEGRYALAHKTLYNVHQRVAETYRKERVFLAGDAAHINNPIGGMGLNGGVHDAFCLADKLIRVLARGEPDVLLDSYERERRDIAISFINESTARNKRNLEEQDPAVRKQRQLELRRIADTPAEAKAYLLKTSMFTSLGGEAKTWAQ
ncbi:MAG: NAD(P)/FAD-dependent oxidoreductase [Pseudomonadota bacterium]